MFQTYPIVFNAPTSFGPVNPNTWHTQTLIIHVVIFMPF